MDSYWTNPDTIHETIDGETIIIDLSTGTYYSLRGSAPAIWSALAEGASVETVVERLQSLYDVAPGEIAVAVETFLRQLETECLIVPGTGPAAPARAAEP
jgi:Coenzyme PQQ synthesis protein D (PqqD)